MRLVWALLVLVSVPGVEGATWRSANFVVKAPNQEIARTVTEHAEAYRRSKALVWLGFELPPWPRPCEVEVRLALGNAGGATSFTFDEQRVVRQEMVVEGPLDRILESVLPHEVTHTVFAARFGRPLPRWADEGGAVLSEDYLELRRHDLLVRELINAGRMIPLRRLFLLTEYPPDVMALYAQGFSVARYLVALRGERVFLDFVWDGQQTDWDSALAQHYGLRRVEDCEARWIEWLRAGKGTGADLGPAIAARQPTGSRVVRAQIPDESPARDDPSPTVRQPSPQVKPKTTGIIRVEPLGNTSPQRPTQPAITPPPPRRLVPIAVGRTRRAHPAPSSTGPAAPPSQ